MGPIEVHQVHESLGIEIAGFDPRAATDETHEQLRRLFDDHGLLVFRDLDIDEPSQKALVHRLIGADPTEAVDPPGPSPFYVSNKEQGADAPYGRLLFHCDAMWSPDPQQIISLYGVEVAQPSPPTWFVSMRHGWDTLPLELRSRVQDLQARHGFEGSYPNRGGDDDVIDTDFGQSRSATTPVALRHPRTGHTLLYVSQQATIEILGLTEAENEELLSALFEHLYDPSRVASHEWRQGDLVVWDNIALQHARGPVQLDGPTRTLRKNVGPMSQSISGLRAPSFSKLEAS